MSRINTNVESLIARRAITVNNASLNQALARLSTGLRINNGRDDPAGLIASETLRSNIRAIDTAIGNATRADTIVSVAEGGLDEVSGLLLDLENLIDQTSNQAGLTPAEIQANQVQIDSILNSINRLAEATAFGDKKLLNGNLAFTTSGVNINEPTGATLSHLDRVQINAAKIPNGSFRQISVNVVAGSTYAQLSATPNGIDATDGARGETTSAITTLQIRGIYGADVLTFASGTTTTAMATAVNAATALTGVSAVVSGLGTAGSPQSLILTSNTYGNDALVSVSMLEAQTAAGVSLPGGQSNVANGTNGTVTINGTNAVVSGLDASIRSGSLAVDLTLTTSFGGTTGSTTSFQITGGGGVFSISPTVGLSGQEALGIDEVSTAKLGSTGTGFLATLGTGLTNDLASKNFTSAQRIVREAISQVATLRGRLGGFQKDTLQTTINSLRIARENVTAAESAIRDADFAVETSNLTRAQILVASSTQVLQLANAQPQNALALLG